jgi:hypothetical protein
MSQEETVNPNLNYQNDITPSFNFIVKDVALKSLLFSMLFYIMNSNLINKLLQCLDKYPLIDKNFIQSILFGLVFYFISVNL